MRPKRGFSLIELIIAITISGIVVVTLTMAMTSLYAQQVKAQQMQVAAQLARERIEEIKAAGYEGASRFDNVVETTIPDFPGFTRTSSVTEVTTFGEFAEAGAMPEPPVAGLKRIEVTVAQTGASPLTLVTMVGPNE